jgi:hypothetical protein
MCGNIYWGHRFIWKEFAARSCCIKGEFTGWKEEEMRYETLVTALVFCLVEDVGCICDAGQICP